MLSQSGHTSDIDFERFFLRIQNSAQARCLAMPRVMLRPPWAGAFAVGEIEKNSCNLTANRIVFRVEEGKHLNHLSALAKKFPSHIGYD